MKIVDTSFKCGDSRFHRQPALFFTGRLKVWETELFVIRFHMDHNAFLSVNFFITKYYII